MNPLENEQYLSKVKSKLYRISPNVDSEYVLNMSIKLYRLIVNKLNLIVKKSLFIGCICLIAKYLDDSTTYVNKMISEIYCIELEFLKYIEMQILANVNYNLCYIIPLAK